MAILKGDFELAFAPNDVASGFTHVASFFLDDTSNDHASLRRKVNQGIIDSKEQRADELGAAAAEVWNASEEKIAEAREKAYDEEYFVMDFRDLKLKGSNAGANPPPAAFAKRGAKRNKGVACMAR